MNAIERIKMVKAMEFIARQVNDEELFYDFWLSEGVADGDITLGDLSVHSDDIEELDYYLSSENFACLMRDFMKLMRAASRHGGLYCDGVVSQRTPC